MTLRAVLDAIEQKTLPGHSAREVAVYVPRLVQGLRLLVDGIEYAHTLHTGEWMPNEPANCAHPACVALAALDALANKEED